MVSKCANPDCSASFRYLHTGKLFRFEMPIGLERRAAMGESGVAPRPLKRLQFYWLCESCAPRMTLAYEAGSGVKVEPYASRVSAAA